MFRLPSLTALSRRPLTPWHRAALFGAGLLVLWLALQLAPSAPAAPPPDVRSAEAAGRIPGRGEAPAASDRVGVPTRPERGFFRTGNVVALLLLGGGGAWALHLRRQRPEGEAAGREPALQALDALTLAPGQSVRLVSVGDEVLLLGVSQGGISLLRRYDAGEAPETAPAPAPPPAVADFADLLRHAGVGQRSQTHHG